MTRLLRWIIGLFFFFAGMALLLSGLIFWTALARLSATQSEGDVWDTPASKGELSVWVYTPHVSPGDRLVVTVGVYGGLAVAIDNLDVRLGEEALHLRGKGKDWGQKIERKGLDVRRGSDTLAFEMEVPADASPDDVLTLRCDVGYTLARHGLLMFGGRFLEEKGRASIEVPITVRSRWQALLGRGLSAGQAVGLFLLVFLLLRWLEGPLQKAGKPPDPANTGGVAGAIGFTWGLAYGYAGYLFFALPLQAATSWTSTWVCVVLVVLWLAGPLALALRFPLKQEEPPP